MASYMSNMGMRRSYEPQPAASAAARAGVGLLFQTSGDGKIVVKEVVKGGSAARSGQIKGGDVIMRVGTTSVQNQSLVNLRELILGEPGSYVTLSFSRGGMSSQPYDVSLMRGSPEYLDQHGGDAGTRSMAAPTMHAPTASLGGASREGDEIERLRSALSTSQAEVSRLRGNLRSQELLVERNGEELRSYREAMEQSQDKLRQGTANADRRQHELLAEFKRRYDRERSRLSTALERSQAISRSINSVIPALQSMDRELGIASKQSPTKTGY